MMSSNCERLSELTLARADGHIASSDDFAFAQQHLASCHDCRREASALALLRMNENSPAHFPITGAAREKMLDNVLAQLNSPASATAFDDVDDVPEFKPVPQPKKVIPLASRARRPACWAAGIVAVAATVLAVVRLAQPTATGDAQSAQAKPPLAKVLLASGTSPNGLTAGMAISEGQRLDVTSETSIALGNDIVVLLDPGSHAKLTRLQKGGVEIALENGHLHASVKPHTTGPRLAVSTASGRVEVTGTLFSVKAEIGAATLNVLRGSVRVSAPGQKSSTVEALQAQKIGSATIRSMTSQEQETELSAMRRISLLDAGEASVLQVRSRPAGATVLLDGEAVGHTPFAAEVKTGHRHLRVQAGGIDANEWIDLHAGAVALRDFDLAPSAPVVPAAVPTRNHPAHLLVPANKPVPMAPAAAPRVAASDMLRQAQNLRGQRDWQASANAYRELLAQYPASDLCEPALVSLGQLQLEHLGDARSALRSCETYLAKYPGNALASEAALCRIKSLRTLGRTNEERKAIEAFLADYPSAVQTSLLRERLQRLDAQ